jgi:hypothetical protein
VQSGGSSTSPSIQRPWRQRTSSYSTAWCCYPDYERLLGTVAEHARRLVVFSYPPRNAVSRLFVAVANVGFRLLRREYRSFVHPPAAMVAVLEARGLRGAFAGHTLVWQVAGLERA